MNRKESSWSRFCQIGEGEIRLFLESWSRPVKEHVPGDVALLLSSVDHQRRRLRLLGENRYPVSLAIGGGDADHGYRS